MKADALGKAAHCQNFKNIKEKNLFINIANDIAKLTTYLLRMFIFFTDKREPWPEKPQLEGLSELIQDNTKKTHSDE